MKKQQKKRTLKEIITSPNTEYLMEAHNAISAKIIEETGFSGIWASGLTISSSLGVRDRNEISWTQVLDTVEYMTDAVDCPILLDADTGYGDYNSFRRVVKKLGQRNISGCCIEDKIFPKKNSFIGEKQELASVAEFTAKLKAGVDSKVNDDFVIVARTEALISGWGINEALRRAKAYYEAGADAILIHSKASHANEILEFCELFDTPCPVVIVPTKYYNTPPEKFEQAGISTVIWANHSLRASVKAIQDTAKAVYNSKSLLPIEKEVAPLTEIFRLSGEHEMELIEKKYVPTLDPKNIIFLAASRGEYLKSMTKKQPKCLLEINGKPLLQHNIQRFRNKGILDISVVSGYASQQLDKFDVRNIKNDSYESTGECYSLNCAIDQLRESTIVCYGDLLLDDHILTELAKDETDADIVLYIDKSNEKIENHKGCFVRCSSAFSPNPFKDSSPKVKSVVNEDNTKNAHGQWIGLLKVTENGLNNVKSTLTRIVADNKNASINDLIDTLLKNGVHAKCVYLNGGWIDINTAIDLEFAKYSEAKTA
ncbi:phosphoenolpyruvate mutase [uncultured Shewanella sp.]|uniref:phosphoenolpyruvate mutase n=1 Tax=uncultured Shewanella sp. TaxID=173975 RepID=UPI00263115F2|nr:phosphoenolpyruvate mutase [uncultured Shewanella sp.]